MNFGNELAGKEERRNETEFRKRSLMNEDWMTPNAFEWLSDSFNSRTN